MLKVKSICFFINKYLLIFNSYAKIKIDIWLGAIVKALSIKDKKMLHNHGIY